MHLFLQSLALVVLISIFLFIFQTRRRGNERKHVLHRPPGPPGLPIIGNLHQFLSNCPHLYFHELSKTYGPLFSLKLGFVPTLVVSSAKLAKEVMKTHDIIFSNRPKLATHQKLSYNGFDIAFAPYGEQWRQLKKVSIIHLFSNKKARSFCSIREEEVHWMMQKISRLSDEGKVIDLSEMMICLTSTVVCKIAFGRRYDGGNYITCERSFQDILIDAQEMFVSFCFADYFPFLGWVDKLTGMSSRLYKVFMELDRFYEKIIEEHLKSVRVEDDQEDLVDVLLDLQRESSLSINITMDHIKGILMNVFIAGTDTSAATVIWAMTELVKNPESMRRAQQEARTLMGNKIRKIIKEEDLEQFIYLKAVVKETMRLHPVAPLLVPRETTQKCTLHGYEIQEKTLVFVNAWAIGRDPESWNNQEEFSPERFLGNNKEIDFRGHDFELIPFGSGRRMCPGMQMGVAMVELTLANLIYLFDWKVPVGMEKQVLDTSVLPGITTHKKNPLCLVATKSSEI